MARTVGFYIVFNHIPAIIASVEANARMAVKSTADKIVADAKARAPHKTGFLRSSIESKVVSAGKEADIYVWADYAAYVEFGTYKMPARPFLAPAMAAHVDDFAGEVGKGGFKL